MLALDGIPLRVVEAARARGAFRDWPGEVPLVSTFPSLTNVAFTAILQPFGVEPAHGYEVQYFDRKRNAVVGHSPVRYHDRLFPWRNLFDNTSTTVKGKLAIYTRPRFHARRAVEEAAATLLESPKELVLSHVGATDALLHIRGDAAVVDFVVELDRRLILLKQQHVRARGRPLRLVLLSDHGNGRRKVHLAAQLRQPLREAGLRPADSLGAPDDVVAATFGIVSYGALFTRPPQAETAARAIVQHPAVELANWISGESEVTVVSPAGEAVIRWKEGADERSFAYEARRRDPLRFASARAALAERRLLDEDGFAGATDWLEASIRLEYPDALRRVVDGLTSSLVENRATVLLSLQPGFAWGWRSAHASSRFTGGLLEGTHGGLDRDSSLGFFLTDDPLLNDRPALHAAEALEAVVPLHSCTE